MCRHYNKVKKYKHHGPEITLLYQFVERYYPASVASLAEQVKYLHKYVEHEFDDFLGFGSALSKSADCTISKESRLVGARYGNSYLKLSLKDSA
jgi:hypothetical protein